MSEGVYTSHKQEPRATVLNSTHPLSPPTFSHGHDLDPSASLPTATSSSPGGVGGLLVLRQVRGISQGSVLSPALCHLYLGSVEAGLLLYDDEDEDEEDEHEHCTRCTCGPRQRRPAASASMALRLVDDYLCVTTSLPTAKRFLDRVYARLPAIGA